MGGVLSGAPLFYIQKGQKRHKFKIHKKYFLYIKDKMNIFSFKQKDII